MSLKWKPMKRQAYEVIQEIERKWKKRIGVMMWSWSGEHLAFLMSRWVYKDPKATERQTFFRNMIQEAIQERIRAKAPLHWLYIHKEHIREMMEGAGLDTRVPVKPSRVTDFSVIELKRQQPQMIG